MPTTIYPIAVALAEGESLEIVATALKRRIYPDAFFSTEIETLAALLGLKWFLAPTEAETTATAWSTAIVKNFASAAAISDFEINCAQMALWPEPPKPTATLSYQGNDLHKQILQQGNSHQLGFVINFKETTLAAIKCFEISFELKRPEATQPFLKKTWLGQGGLIVDFLKQESESDFLMTGDIQLRSGQTVFPEDELEARFYLRVENFAISQKTELLTGTVIFRKD